MKFEFKEKILSKTTSLFFLITALSFSFGCEAPRTETNVTTNANIAVNTNTSPSADTSTVNKNTEMKMPVTLPVLDAMMTDDAFAAELKSKLQLTDEEIDKLKNASRSAVADLNEDETGEKSGSTRAALDRADKQIRGILGSDKANRFFEFVGQKWSNGGTDNATNNLPSPASSAPNSVPTDTRIVVNAPAYRMDIFKDGKLLKTYKIGIGYPEFPLPNGMRRADTIIFNPTWTPPDEPWVKGKLKPGQTIEAGSKDNPLGPIKIPIGLPSLIHGGKSPARLGGFASHGCVGLTNTQVQTFASDLAGISGTNLTGEDVKNYEKQKTETKNVKLGTAIPVELRYETIVVEDGKLKIFRDVYERGTNTEENLRRVLDAFGVSLDSLPQVDRDKILSGLKQMAIDAEGNPVDENAADAVSDANKTANSNSKSNNNNQASEKVTRNIKGKKEVVFELALLKGKGYPAPVNLVQK